MNPSKEHHEPVSRDLRCLWMSAGVLSYWLCDLEFNCDSCPLDAAMRRKSAEHRNSSQKAALSEKPGVLREGFLYSPSHCWARQISESVLRVGVEPGLSMAILTPKAVVLPSQGQSLQKKRACAWIDTDGGTLPLGAPCSGVVRAINRQLSEHPHLLLMKPFDEGWLFDLEVSEPFFNPADFLDWNQASSVYAADQDRLMNLLASASHAGRPAVGVTLADGGQRLQNIAEVLGPVKYFSLLRKVFGA